MITAVVGGQYGSEGKGVIVHHIANRYDVHVRTGGPNAGHSFQHLGKVWKMQVIPCGWTNPNAHIIIGRGALVDPHQLQLELEAIRKVDPTIDERLFIDADAGVLDSRYHMAEGGVAGAIHARIGSTGEGVGEARMARIARNPEANGFRLWKDAASEFGFEHLSYPDTPRMLHESIRQGDHVLLEGTQGSGLSLIHGPWPYCTSQDTNAATLAAEAGIPPQHITDVLLVVRTYPIRVAGNSGPLERELTWEQMSARIGKPVEEKTTVTRLVRRVGEWDPDLIKRSSVLNSPTSVALTFADYISPQDEGKKEWNQLSRHTIDFAESVGMVAGAPVNFIGTGGSVWSVCERG